MNRGDGPLFGCPEEDGEATDFGDGKDCRSRKVVTRSVKVF